MEDNCRKLRGGVMTQFRRHVLRDRDADENTSNGLQERIYVLHDSNYNVTALVDTSGEVIERYYYEAYGRAVYLDDAFALLPDAQSQFAWQHLHQGGRLDTITGNYHFRHRDLSPTLGKWISQDPIGFEADDANLYRYVGNGPTTRVVPSGPEGVSVEDSPPAKVIGYLQNWKVLIVAMPCAQVGAQIGATCAEAAEFIFEDAWNGNSRPKDRNEWVWARQQLNKDWKKYWKKVTFQD